jgi:hypothetical protein
LLGPDSTSGSLAPEFLLQEGVLMHAASSVGWSLMLALVVLLLTSCSHQLAKCEGPLEPLNASSWQPTPEVTAYYARYFK